MNVSVIFQDHEPVLAISKEENAVVFEIEDGEAVFLDAGGASQEEISDMAHELEEFEFIDEVFFELGDV